MFMNTKSKLIEKFETTMTLPRDKVKLEEIVTQLYKDLYPSQVPSTKIIAFYVDYAMRNSITESDLRRIMLQKVIYGTEDEVTELYNLILFRNPDEAELVNFAKLLKEDKTFTIEKLKTILYSSAEYKRLEKTQSNKVYGDVMNNVTDRQLTHMVEEIYKQVTQKELVDADSIRFLKKKFVEQNLDEEKFKQFIKNYMNNEAPATATAAAKEAPAAKEAQVAKEAPATTAAKEAPATAAAAKEATAAKEAPAATQEDLNKLRDEIKKLREDRPNKPVIEILLKTANENNASYIDSQNVLKEIKKEAKCVFDKEAIKQVQTLAEIQQARNKQNMQSTCTRNMKALGYDEDMVLDPSLKWSVPQKHPPVCTGGQNDYKPDISQTSLIGTLLVDATNTKVGSILPMNPPR